MLSEFTFEITKNECMRYIKSACIWSFLVRIFPDSDWMPYSVWMRENADQKNSKYGHFLRSDRFFSDLLQEFVIRNPYLN